MFGSRRRASTCAAIDCSNSPQYRHACTRPANSSGSLPCRDGFAKQANERSRRLSDVGLEVGVELVRQRQPRD